MKIDQTKENTAIAQPIPILLRLLETSLVQLFFIILLVSISSFSLADNTAYLRATSPAWLDLATKETNNGVDLQLATATPKKTGEKWAFAFDNDVLVPGHRDQDYTYGLNFTQSGIEHKQSSLAPALVALDSLLGNHHMGEIGYQESFSRELGAFGFTPEDISISTPNPNDRPYASLVYLSSSREQVDLLNNRAWKSTMTIGALGLDLVGEMQNFAHKNTEGTTAEGWKNQISDGGELTAKYALARQQYFDQFSDKVEIKSTLQGSVGYLTEASWGISMRAGKIHSPWSSFNPELASYGEKSSYSSSAKAVNERFFWAGFSVKARVYNAFLQGQFRNSAVSYEHNELRPLLLETWVGYTFAFKQGYRISYVLRGHSSEIKQGAGDRNLLWGGIIVARSI